MSDDTRLPRSIPDQLDGKLKSAVLSWPSLLLAVAVRSPMMMSAPLCASFADTTTTKMKLIYTMGNGAPEIFFLTDRQCTQRFRQENFANSSNN